MRRLLALLFLASLSMPPGAAYSELHWGIEAGVNRSSLQRTIQRPRETGDPRILPAVGILLECPVAADWSLGPAIRYVQQGTVTTWQDQTAAGGREEVIQHALGGGVGFHLKLPYSLFLAADPEITYLLSGTLKSSRVDSAGMSASFEDDVVVDSDRWNVTIRAGLGKAWRMGGGIATLSVRYFGGINDMTRIVPSHVVGEPPEVSEWKIEGLELMAGFLW